MKPRALILLFLVLALSPAAADPATGRIEGTVSESGGQPIAGAKVLLLPATKLTKTDGSGHFVFDGLAPRDYSILVEARGFARGSTKVTVTGGQTSKLAMALQRAPVEKAEKEKAMDEPATEEMKVPVAPAKPSPRGAAQAPAVAIPYPGPPPPPRMPDDNGGNTEEYKRIDDNAFERVTLKPLSTFSIDVDTASYSNVRRFLREGTLPPKDAVRVEELVNYFRYAYPAPKANEPFGIVTEVGPAPWDAKHRLVHIGLATRAIDASKVPARNLVFLIDVSGSMQDANKLGLLKDAMSLLVANLRPEDRVSMVVYAGSSGLVLAPTAGDHKSDILDALLRLEAGGSTNGAAGIQQAYDTARKTFIKGGINRVILCTDGDFNVGPSSEGELTRLIEEERKSGVFLTVLGFGMGNIKDSHMEQLADKGNGNYAYIDSIHEAQKVLVKEAGATLVTVAKDVKIQVEFNPSTVAGYRLIGYENRLLRDQDFNDDTKDAGDVGAGHTVTALYELIPAGQDVPGAKVDDLKYQKPAAKAGAADSTELFTLKVRYKEPAGDKSSLLSRSVNDADRKLDATSVDFRFSAAVAAFGMLLRDSPYHGQITWKQVAAMAKASMGQDPEGYRREFIDMVTTAERLAAPATAIAK